MRLTITKALLNTFSCLAVTIEKAEWKPVFDREDIFPSYTISTASMERPSAGAASENYIGDPNEQVGCNVTATKDNQKDRAKFNWEFGYRLIEI